MDLSKLPGMSRDRSSPPPTGDGEPETPPSPPGPQQPPEEPRRLNYAPSSGEPGVGLQVYLSLALGIIFMLMGLRFVRWLFATATGRTFDTDATWTTGPDAGQAVGYFELAGYAAWTDMAFFIFGLALVLEAVAVLATVRAEPKIRNAALLLAIAVCGLATLLNLGLCIVLFNQGVTPLASLLMTVFGGYITMYLFQLRTAWAISDAAR